MAGTDWRIEPASEPQLDWIRDLAQTKVMSDEQAEYLASAFSGKRLLNKGIASRIIDALKDAPQKQVSSDAWPDVPAGRYAVVDPKDDLLKFYLVDKPQEGRWKGYTFLKVFASDNLWPIKDTNHRTQILKIIQKDPKAAAVRYGNEIGRCWKCHRKLTKQESRELGIGPICAAKEGWL